LGGRRDTVFARDGRSSFGASDYRPILPSSSGGGIRQLQRSFSHDRREVKSAESDTATKSGNSAKIRAGSGARPKQRFTVSHARDADFKQGLRAYATYRDLGIAAATGGVAQAHVIRFVSPFRPEEAATPHYHEVDFQMIYVLRGWYKTEFEGEGEHTFEAGSCWIQPPGIKHAVRGYSDDCELLEIVLPADFETVTLPNL
jgi:quercetin dioxygenase-like cupin family protein